MAADCVDGDYLGAYSRFFTDFIARVNPDDQLPVKVSAYDVNESELVGEIISVTLQYLNQTYCPPSLQSYIVHLVIQAIKLTCKKQPEICGLRQQEKTYAPLKLMQAITNSVNEICRRYLDNSRLALLPPPSPTQQVSVGATRNARRKMEDRHVVLHDLHTIFNIQDDTMANYYAVFDGHGGQDAAAYCATHLHQYLAESVHYPTDPERALRDAFLTTDAQFIAKSSTQKLNGGTTAVCALVLNKKLYIAWVGDSMASLVTRGNVKQLVNPHRPTRKDECERIQNMGGVIVHCMGVLRVNGFLSISRAIGDVSYKPYISGEPEIRCVPLDGTEDFLIIACDGLWDYVDPRTAALRVYRQVLQNPHDLKYVQQALLQSAKRAGSLDNITVIVVFLTPPIEIASQHSHLANQPSNGLLLNNMDPNNPISSNAGQFDVNAAFIKQQQQQQHLNADLEHMTDFDIARLDINRTIYETARNGKHQNNDDDYDFSDLGPETNVDAIEDVDPNIGCRNASSSSRELLSESEESAKNEECNNDSNNDKNDNNDDSDLNRDNANVCPVDPVVDVDNRVRPSDRDVCDADDEAPCGKADDGEARVDSTGTHTTVVDDDESPPSPRATKPLQHALIPEAENVADSEDSEDEWNYYRIDPNKEESATTAVAAEKICKGVEELNILEKNTVSIAKGSLEFTSPEIVDDIKCEKLEKEISSSELVNIDISDKGKPSESVKDLVSIEDQEQINAGDMDFQLNPEAAEFVPLSSPLLSNRNFLQDYPISGSPLKQTPMDDIPVPSQSEFEQEVCQRPREMDEKDYASDVQSQTNSDQQDLDVSDVSSTKVEVGDSVANTTISTTQWQPDTSSQWTENTSDHTTKLGLEDYIVDKNDPMMMSFEPDEFAAAFKKDLDLNAVHDLSDSSESSECKVKSENGAEESDENEPERPSRSPLPIASEERVHTPFSDDKDTIDLLCTSSTPQPPADEKKECAASSEVKDMSFSTGNPFLEQPKDSATNDNQAGNTTQLESFIASEVTSDDVSTDDYYKHTSSVDDNVDSSDSNFKEVMSLDCQLNIFKPDDFKMLESEEELAREKSDTYFERAALIEEKYRLPESELDKKASDETSSSLGGFSKDSDTEEQLFAQSNITRAEFTVAYTQPDEYTAKLEQLSGFNTSRNINKETTFTEEQIFLPCDDAETSNQAQKHLITESSKARKGDDDDNDDNNDDDDDLKDFDKDDKDNTKPYTLNPLDYIQHEITVTECPPHPVLGAPIEGDFLTFLKEHTTNEVTEIEKEPGLPYIPPRLFKITPKVTSEDIPVEKETEPRKDAEAPQEDVAKANESEKQIAEAAAATAATAVATTAATEAVATTAETAAVAATAATAAVATTAATAAVAATAATAAVAATAATAAVAATAATAAAAAVAATAVTACSTKAKATSSTTTKRPATKSTTTKAAPVTKTATKSMPTSPSKAVSTTVRVTTTQSVAAKKPPAARPKQLDGATKVTVSSSNSNKTTAARTTTTPMVTTTTIALKTTMSSTMTKVSPRRIVGTTKPKVTTTTAAASSKLSAGATAEKKSINGDAKLASKTTVAAKPPASAAARTSSGAIAKTTLVKTSSTTTKTSAVASKPRPASAKTSISPLKQLSTSTNSATTGATRPKTAPPSAGTPKLRDSIGKTMPAKSPSIDKQSKETVNKQISRSGASPSSRTIGRVSGTPTSITKTRTSIGKSPANASAISPMKRSAVTPKTTSKPAAGTKNAPTSETKVLQNGISSENKETVNKTVVITNDIINQAKLEDDVPRKDASPVNVPTDNQLIDN